MDERADRRAHALVWAVLTAGVLLALYMAFIAAPRERTMGDLQRIFYFHVAAGMSGLTALAVNFAASIVFLVKKTRSWDSLALAAAEVGVLFLVIVLVTGPIWAKPVWLVWWTWSPRLTSSLVLCLLYVAYLLIRNYVEDPERRGLVSAVFAAIAFLDAPLVWFSIRWWRDIHPSAMLETGGVSRSMRPALWVAMAAMELLMAVLIRQRFLLESARGELERLERHAAD